MSIAFYSKIKKIERKTRLVRAWKTGPNKEDVKSETEDMGWYMLLEGSWEYLYIGNEAPKNLATGDEVIVIIGKAKS
jgi:hypothetical protein